MAGSRKWFDYEADNGTTYAMEQDEGNGVAVGNTALTSGASEPLPKSLKPRHIVATWVNAGTTGQGTGITTRKIAVGDPAAFAAFTRGDTISLPEYQAVAGVGQTTPNVMRAFVIQRKVPELYSRLPRVGDTNMDQG